MSILTTPAILLRSHPYSETSRVLRFYTRDMGLLGTMARGVRKGASRGRGGTATFGEGVAVITFRANRDLQSLHEFTPTKAHLGLARDFRRLAGASVAAELILRHAQQEPHPELFEALSTGLRRLEETDSEAVVGEVLALCWRIVHLLGFGPELEVCTACGVPLEDEDMGRFDLEEGAIRGPGCPAAEGSRRIGPVARTQLAALLRGEMPPNLRGVSAHLSLLDDFTTFHMLGGRRLESFRFLEPPSPPERDAPAHT